MKPMASPFNGFRKLGRRDSVPPTPPIITQSVAPTFGPYTAGDTPEDAYVAGTYASTAGTISSAVAQWTINGVSALGSDVLAEDDVVGLSVLVTDSVANTRTFSYGVAAAAGAGLYVARFGVGADNATGTGAFDTSLYDGATPSDGTYGDFTVASGVITPDGTQTAGTYDVGGWPVEVISGYKAVANQTQFDALTPANSSGKTILIREAAALSVTNAWNNGGDFGWATILGDGTDYRADYLDATKDSRKHFITWLTENTKKLILDSLNFVTGSIAAAKVGAITFDQTGGGNNVADIQILRCRLICSRPGAFDDFSAGISSFPGGAGIKFGGTTVLRASVRDNVIHGAHETTAAISMQAVTGWAECVGNHVDMFYGDGIRLPSILHLCSSNLITRPLALSGDAGDPHGDAIQLIGGIGVIEAIGMAQGDTRGNWQNFFAGSTQNYQLMVRDSVISDDSLYAYSILGGAGSTIENCVWLPKPGWSLPVTGTYGGMRYQDYSGVNNLKNSVHRDSSANIDVGIVETGVVDSSTWNATDYGNNFPDWNYSLASVPTLESLLGTIGLGASAAAGKSPRILSTGAERSDIVLNLTAPVLSSLSLTPATDGFTGTVASDTTKAPIFWCVVSNGSPAPTWRQIKERRATGALVYGDGWVTGATLALSTNALSSSTTYTVYAVQELGWSKQSNIISVNVTTAAANISRVGVGATVGSNSTNSLVLDLPTGLANGDYLVAITSHLDSTAEPTLPLTGWTFIGDGVAFTGGQPAVAVWGRVRDGTEGATQTIGFANTGVKLGFIAAYRGVSGVGNVTTDTVFSASTRPTAPLTATANSCIIHIYATESNGGTMALTGTGAEIVGEVYNPANTYYLGADNQLSVSAGTTDLRWATNTTSGSWNTMQIELLD